jgi:hypothetical protein
MASNKGRKKRVTNVITDVKDGSLTRATIIPVPSKVHKKTPLKSSSKFEKVSHSNDKVVQYGIRNISPLLKPESNFSIILVVWYILKSPFIDLLPIQSRSLQEIGGSLVTSFVRNEFPTHLHRVTLSDDLLEDDIPSEDIVEYVNTWSYNLSERRTIQHCQSSLISQVLEQTGMIFQASFTIPKVRLHLHSHVVLSFLN